MKLRLRLGSGTGASGVLPVDRVVAAGVLAAPSPAASPPLVLSPSVMGSPPWSKPKLSLSLSVSLSFSLSLSLSSFARAMV